MTSREADAVISSSTIQKRKLPKLLACMTKLSLDNMRNKAIFNMDVLDAKGIRRRRLPLHVCLILELKESGYTEASNYLQDLLYDNAQLVAEDEIGLVVDLTKRDDYLEHICAELQKAEKERDRDNVKKESLVFLNLALCYSEKGKGILWLAEKFFLVAIAVSSRYMVDGGRLKGCCKYHYSKFLLDKFPGADPDEPSQILTEVRDSCIGKPWPLYEAEGDEEIPDDTLFCATSILLHRVLLCKSRAIRKQDPAKSERLARLAERKAIDANEATLTGEAIIEVGICQLLMNNLNNAQKTFERGFKILLEHDNALGLCEIKMHMAAVMQKLGDHETAARLLTEMGALAMKNNFRRQLGRALHLLGELHLRRERPELGTQHLSEAFACFMGFSWHGTSHLCIGKDKDVEKEDFDIVYNKKHTEIYEEEAEQSRLMMAISAAQERMASYFDMIREGGACAVARIKCIEWKLSKAGWWIKKRHHDLQPCMCKAHNRSPMEVLREQIKLREEEALRTEVSEPASGMLNRGAHSMENIQAIRSSFNTLREESRLEIRSQYSQRKSNEGLKATKTNDNIIQENSKTLLEDQQ